MAAGKKTAADLGAYVCFEDEAGQGLRPPRGRTWAPRGRRPLVRVRGRGTGRVNVAGVLCYRPGDRSRFFYVLHLYRGRWGEPKAFSWRRYRDLIVMTHLRSGAPVVWCWDNLNVHLTRVVKRKLKKIPYRPHLIDGCLPPTGLTMEPDTATPADITSSS